MTREEYDRFRRVVLEALAVIVVCPDRTDRHELALRVTELIGHTVNALVQATGFEEEEEEKVEIAPTRH